MSNYEKELNRKRVAKWRKADPDRAKQRSREWNENKPAAYSSWLAMKKRCNNPNHNSYKNYGAKGVTVCSKWLNSFNDFLKDMGERPDGMSIDRINTSGNYEPSNCRWTSMKDQNNNKRRSE